MEFIKEATENEMIANFLKAEINSKRFGRNLRKHLKKCNEGDNILYSPDLENKDENEIRRKILALHRGYGVNRFLFKSFPHIERWEWVNLNECDLRKIKYINQNYWIKLSGGSRSAVDAANNIKEGLELSGVCNEQFLLAAEALVNGAEFAPMILIKTYDDDYLVVIEGHLRLTSYMLAPDAIPKKLEAIVGYTSKEKLKKWSLY